MKNKFFLFFAFFLFSKFFVFSQEIFEVKKLMITSNVKGILTIEKYPHKELHKNLKCSCPINTVEQKFCNFFNINTKEDLINFFKPYNVPQSYSKEDYLDKMKIYDKSNNFYLLDSKYIFDYGMSKDIFIKYINNNEVFPKSVYSVNYFQSFDNDLIIKEMGENFDVGMFLINSNTNKTIDYLNVLKDKEIDITLFCSNFLENIKSNSVKNNLQDLLDKGYSPFFEDKINETIIKGDVLQKTYNYKRTLHDMISGIVLANNKISKKEISEKYNIPIENLVKDSLSVKEVIDVNTLNNDFTIVKFYDSKTIIKTSYEIIDNDLIYKNISLLGILSKLNLDFFVELCVNNKSLKFPEANKLQPLIKNSDGSININKLADVIEKNKILLSKYLDE